MPAAVRFGDLCTGHGCWGSRNNDSASNNVYINTLGAHRVGDHWVTHCCVECHDSTQGTGSPNVFVNGVSLARIGDQIVCGSYNMTGSGNVFANG